MISKAIQNANDEAKKRVKERQSFIDADEHAVQAKIDGLQQYVPLGTIKMQGMTVADWVRKIEQTVTKLAAVEKVVDTLTQSSAEQAKLLDAVVQTLKGVKL